MRKRRGPFATVLRAVAFLALAVVLVAGIFAANVALGMRASARVDGTVGRLAVKAPVSILRDARGIPHIVAANEHDLFFAQGYVEASDRLFQMDLLRRFIEGELADAFGAAALPSDEAERAVPIRAIVAAQWNALDPRSRDILDAFSDGVNAAMQNEPLPVEFRILAYKPKPWTPQDSLAVSMATVLDLTDDWNEIEHRDRAFRDGGQQLVDARFPFTDPCYDAPVLGGLRAMGPGPACTRRVALLPELADERAPIGSNELAAGAAHTSTGHALLASDPHLGLSIPGVWYLIGLQAPGFHAAGATFPGSPGVVLGHNDHLAWAATNGTVASLSVFVAPPNLDRSKWETETFHVRFGGDATRSYYRDGTTFGLNADDGRFLLVRWNAYERPAAPLPAFDGLDRARSIPEGLAALARFPGPTQNFALADDQGNAAYALAGGIPNDPLWARRVHPARDLAAAYPDVPFASLPKVEPSRDAIVWTANNKMYATWPLPLSAQFAPPYRAYRIAQLLRARSKYDVAYFTQLQMDVLSLPERDLAAMLGIKGWDGRMSPDSTIATQVAAARLRLTEGHNGRMPSVIAAKVPAVLKLEPSPLPWGTAGAIQIKHALASFGIDFMNGTLLPGNGDPFTLHMQSSRKGGADSQSFRAVWDVGNWEAGGITIPQGESGEPGSGHYVDQAPAWLAGTLLPLPYSERAVEQAAVHRETLAP